MTFSYDKKGMSLIEIVVATALTGVLFAGAFQVMDRVIHFKATSETLARTKKIETALETTYRENISYVEQNCYGWTGTGCTTLTLVPTRHSTDNTILLLRTYSANATGAWENAGCTLTGTSPSYNVTCQDGFGPKYTFAATNTHAANSLYGNGYNRTPYTLSITSGGNTDITDTWNSGYLDAEYVSHSQKKILTMSAALRSYHVSRLVNEAVVGTCRAGIGGLDSFDDVIVPWYFQSTGSAPTQACSGIESGNCGCSGLTSSIWHSSGSGWSQINTVTEFSTVLGNIGLDLTYRVDGFGNPAQIWFTVNSAGTLQAEPPRPRPSYSGVWSISPPYSGLIGVYTGSSWTYSQRVTYAQ